MSGIYVASGAKILPPRHTSLGGAAPFSPLDLTPHTWLRGDMGATSTQWDDSSGNGHHVTQPGAVNLRPVPNSSNSSYNNQATMDFTNGLQWMQSAAFGASITQPYTVYWAGEISSGAGATDGITVTDRMLILRSGAVCYLHAGAYGCVSTTSPATKHIWCGIINGASSKWYVDKYATAEVTGDAGSHVLTGLTVGAFYDGTNCAVGSTAELIIYTGSHSQANRQSVTEYMGTRYGVTITA